MSLRATRSRANTANSNAVRPSPSTLMSGHGSVAISTRWSGAPRDEGCCGALMIMQSNGGMYDLAAARNLPVQMMELGPAAGVAGTQALCNELGIADAISFDMGGTTAKACVIVNGAARTTPDYFVGGYNAGLPVVSPCSTSMRSAPGEVAWPARSRRRVHVGRKARGRAWSGLLCAWWASSRL